MALPRVRVTILGMMIAVAIVAAVLGAFARRRRFESLATYHDTKVVYGMACSRTEPPIYFDLNGRVMPSDEAQASEWHASLRDKYLKAATCPWLPVDPDLPPPEP
jgi:hypothetical protein